MSPVPTHCRTSLLQSGFAQPIQQMAQVVGRSIPFLQLRFGGKVRLALEDTRQSRRGCGTAQHLRDSPTVYTKPANRPSASGGALSAAACSELRPNPIHWLGKIQPRRVQFLAVQVGHLYPQFGARREITSGSSPTTQKIAKRFPRLEK